MARLRDALNIYKFHYDPVTPANSTFTLTNTLPTQPFNSIMSSTCTSYALMYSAAGYQQQNRSFGLSPASAVSVCLS